MEILKYGFGFLLGMIVTVVVIVLLGNKYGRICIDTPPESFPAPAPVPAPGPCTPDGAPSTNGTDCCSTNGVDSLGNCALVPVGTNNNYY
jgi:hypothetical protein